MSAVVTADLSRGNSRRSRDIGGGGLAALLWRLLFGRRPKATKSPWPLSQALLHWSPRDAWTIGDSVEGTLVLGATGSGKSSGSGRTLAKAMLAAGYGGLVLTAKKDERAQWERYCRETGRESDLLVFGPDQPLRFNFLDHELRRPGEGAGLTENIVNLFSTVLEVADRGAGGGDGRDSDRYWRLASRQLIRNLVDLSVLAKWRVSVPGLYRTVVSAPTHDAPAICCVRWPLPRAKACHGRISGQRSLAASPKPLTPMRTFCGCGGAPAHTSWKPPRRAAPPTVCTTRP